MNSKNFEDNIRNIENDYQDQNIGSILKAVRVKKGFDINEISSFLKIKLRDLIYIENNDLEKLNNNSYQISIIRAYAKLLKIDEKFIDNKINQLKVKSCIENKNHQLMNIGTSNKLSPPNNYCIIFSFLSLIFSLFLLLIFNLNYHQKTIIDSKKIIYELQNIN